MTTKVRSTRKHSLLQELSFIVDGNRRNFVAPAYQPLVDKHLSMFFGHETRRNIIRKNRLVNRRYQIVDQQALKNISTTFSPERQRVNRYIESVVSSTKSKHRNIKTLNDELTMQVNPQEQGRGQKNKKKRPLIAGEERRIKTISVQEHIKTASREYRSLRLPELTPQSKA